MKRVYVCGVTPELSDAESERLIDSADMVVVNVATEPGGTLPIGFRFSAGPMGDFEVVDHEESGRIALVREVGN